MNAKGSSFTESNTTDHTMNLDIEDVSLDNVRSELDYDASKRVLDAIIDRGGIEHFDDRLSGRSSRLRPSKPTAQDDDALEHYVWRMARFHSGDDPKMPMTCHMDLQGWLDDRDIDASVSGIYDDEGKEVENVLELVVDLVLLVKGMDPSKGAKRWKKAGLV